MTDADDQERRRLEARQRKALAADRRAKAIEMRKLGFTFEEIGKQLGMSAPAVHKTVKKAMEALLEKQHADAEMLRAIDLANLDRIQIPALQGAVKGNHLLMDRVIKIQERRAKLLGLDAPDKVAPTSPDGKEAWQPTDPRKMSPEERRARIRELQQELGHDGDGQGGP